MFSQKGEEEKALPEAQLLTSRSYASCQKMRLALIRCNLSLILEPSDKPRRSKKGKKKKLCEGICSAHVGCLDEACQDALVVRSEAEDSLLAGTESFARLSLSGRVKPVTDPNSNTVVAAFQFLIAT